MKFALKLAAVVTTSIVPLAILGTSTVFCMSPDHSTRLFGAWLALGYAAVTGLSLGVRVMEELDV